MTVVRSRRSRRGRKVSRGWVVAGVVAALVLLAGVRAATIQPRALKPYLSDARPVVLAHRGFSGMYRENTIEAFDQAIGVGADILELDVHTTRDGVIVVHHDPDLAEGGQLVHDLTWAELQVVAPYVPTLDEVLGRYPLMRINIEIKQDEPAMEEPLYDLIVQHGALDRVLVSSFHGSVMKRWRALPGAAQIATSSDSTSTHIFAAYYLTYTTALWQPHDDAFQIPPSAKLGPVTIRLDTARLLRAAHKVGIKVHYWTVNDEAEMERLLKLGADGIITDYPDRAVAVMTKLGLR